MKKLAVLVLAVLMIFSACSAMAEATLLPCGASFGMTMDELSAILGSGAEREVWYEDDQEAGTLLMEACPLGIGDLKATDLYFQVDRNNSAKAPRLSMITGDLPVGENVIASFKAAVASLSEVYGASDSDPLDEAGVEGYVEYGTLYAAWTKADTRISLNMNRMYDESLTIDFINRVNYDADDLK